MVASEAAAIRNGTDAASQAASQSLHALGVIGIALGVGFVISAIISFCDLPAARVDRTGISSASRRDARHPVVQYSGQNRALLLCFVRRPLPISSATAPSMRSEEHTSELQS